MFTLLVETVDADVKAMQAIAPDTVALNQPAPTKIVVVRKEGTEPIAGIVFERIATGVVVRESSQRATTLFVAKLSLAADGRCRYEVDGTALELWQVSRRALEDLFFS
jgi:hypothetical protein